MASIDKELELRISLGTYNQMTEEIAYNGEIKTIIETLKTYLTNLSNRDFQRLDEKYVKVLFYSIAMNLKFVYSIKSEMEVQRKYPDLLLIPRKKNRGYHSIMIEFKYLKKGEESKLEQKQNEARKQIQEYAQFEDIKDIEKLHKYIVVAVVDKIYVEKID